MNLIRKALGLKEKRQHSIGISPQGGQVVLNSPDNFLNVPAIYACMTLISDAIATLPLKGKVNGDNVDNHPKIMLLQEPVENMTPTVWINTIVRNMLFHGNAYAVRNGNDFNIYDNTQVITYVDGLGDITHYQVYSKERGTVIVLKEDMLHFKRLTKDDRGQFGLGLSLAFVSLLDEIRATNEHTSSYMNNGLMSGLWLEIVGKVRPEVLDDIREKFKGLYQGVKNRTNIPAITDGMKLHEIKNNSLKDSSIDILKTAQLKDIAMIFNVPLSLLDASQGNYGSTVEANLMFFKMCINPLLKSIESELNLKLNTGESFKYYFDTASALSGTFKEQIETLARSVDAGILTPNEARQRLGYKDHEDGKTLYAPAGTPTPSGKPNNNAEGIK